VSWEEYVKCLKTRKYTVAGQHPSYVLLYITSKTVWRVLLVIRATLRHR